MMDVIPVIDLKGGVVVRAQGGARHLYAPIVTPLAATSAAKDVVAGFLALHPFKTIYIADLDAIEGQGNHAALIADLEALFPSINFWIDAGIKHADDARASLQAYRGSLVLGSESLGDVTTLETLAREPRMILSLDFRGADFLGPTDILRACAHWPDRLIVMTLARVGSTAGPDFDRLLDIKARAGADRQIYAAGGLRDGDDLTTLSSMQIAGVLVASALHDGRLDAQVLSRLSC